VPYFYFFAKAPGKAVADYISGRGYAGNLSEMPEPSINDLNLITLKHGNAYAIFDRNGDIAPESELMGLYIDDMRYNSALTLTLGDEKPHSSGAQVTQDNVELVTRLSNPDMVDEHDTPIPANTIHLKRRITLCDSLVHQALTLRNCNDHAVALPLNIGFESDFVDMFNVRGRKNEALGTKQGAQFTQNFARVSWLYHGVDRTDREASIFFSSDPRPERLEHNQAHFVLPLLPGQETTIYLEFGKFKHDAVGPSARTYQDAVDVVRKERAAILSEGAKLEFSDPHLQEWFDRSLGDLALLTTHYDSGPYPCAGLPWFAVPFGRDGIITALEMLWAKPAMAKGVLKFLSDRQALQENPAQDAEPGKIMHETRQNEMSRAGMVPFGLYYGGVDTTLLYIILAGEYLRQTDDRDFISQIWPNIQAALAWIENYAEDKNLPGRESDGFIVYEKKKEDGLTNQMWKDSVDSVFYGDGDTNVKFPRAVCEVQGYAYAAWKTGKRLAELFQDAAKAKHYAAKADRLYERFNEKFWDREKEFYILALDGDKKPCQVKASNMGQLLFTGIVPADRAEKIVSLLTDTKFFSGFGIRTVPEGETRYNPMSYHNGTVWPHDTALIARGMGQTGHTAEALALFKGLSNAAEKNGGRLPELFAGFAREEDFGPVAYPHACSPHAWAAAAAFQLLQAVLGLGVDAGRHEVRINAHNWPPEWGTLTIRNMPVGDKTATFEISPDGLTVLDGKDVDFVLYATGKQGGSVPAPHRKAPL
jgi:glycogen debranching enzyme